MADDSVYLCDTEDYVTEAYANQNCFYCEASGEWDADPPEEEEENTLFEYNENVLYHVSYDRDAIRAGAFVMGVELEMEPKSEGETQEVVAALGGKLNATYILKYDGSVPNGVELVTAPMTLAEHRGARMNWADTLEKVRGIAHSGVGTTRCGMHIHVNKAAVSPLTVGKLLVFLNSDNTDSLVTTIAQRSGNTYCEKKYKRVSEGQFESDCRYERLNITRHTLEFRIFRGNLRAERVLKNIEFAVAAIAYCADAGIRDVSQPERFLAWLGERKRDYPALVAFLREKAVLAHKPATKENSPCV
jgi:hypothetical protein